MHMLMRWAVHANESTRLLPANGWDLSQVPLQVLSSAGGPGRGMLIYGRGMLMSPLSFCPSMDPPSSVSYKFPPPPEFGEGYYNIGAGYVNIEAEYANNPAWLLPATEIPFPARQEDSLPPFAGARGRIC